ncbi:MAG: hypothetical protein ACD_73C00316G0002 [uncultured bacterium]|nr:MAG: hypothetical protein ACD_73C00316G0002 [uncultured bacterium]
MAIDRIDNRRDDDRKAEQKRDDLRRENQRRDAKAKQTSHSFQVQYHSAAQSKKKELDLKKDKDADPSKLEKEGEKKNESLLFKIVQSVKAKEEKSGQQEKDLMKKDEDKKEEMKSEKRSEESSPKSKSVAEDGHKRVGETDGNKQGKDSGGGSNSGGGSGGSGGGGSMGGSKGDSGFGQSSGKGGGGHESQQSLQRVNSILSLNAEMDDGEQNLADSSLNELVEAIFVGTTREGHDELVLHLNDPLLSGIKLSIVKMPEGLHIKLKCESRLSRNKLVMERLKLYDRLKKKNLSVLRIDIE